MRTGTASGNWDGIGDAVVATAILDRLLHHSHVLTIRGDSYRLYEMRRSGCCKSSNNARDHFGMALSLAQDGAVLAAVKLAARRLSEFRPGQVIGLLDEQGNMTSGLG